MAPHHRGRAVHAGTEALETMARDDVSQLPVVVANRVAGLVTRGNVVAFLQTRAGSGK